jgi:acyl-CoA thioester hydrolase
MAVRSDSGVSPLTPYRAKIESDWIDYNGHLRDAYYGLVLSYAADDVMDQLGLDASYRAATRCTLYTLELHIHYLHEVKASDNLVVESLVLDCDRKRMQIGSLFRCSRLAEPVATAESMLLHVHQGEKPTSMAFPAAIEARLRSLKLSPEALAAFGPGSRKIELKRR